MGILAMRRAPADVSASTRQAFPAGWLEEDVEARRVQDPDKRILLGGLDVWAWMLGHFLRASVRAVCRFFDGHFASARQEVVDDFL